MNHASRALRGVTIATLAMGVACGTGRAPVPAPPPPTTTVPDVRSSAQAANGARPVTLRDGAASFTIVPETLAVESGNVSLSAALVPKPTTVTSLQVSPDRVTFQLPEHGLAVDARVRAFDPSRRRVLAESPPFRRLP